MRADGEERIVLMSWKNKIIQIFVHIDRLNLDTILDTQAFVADVYGIIEGFDSPRLHHKTADYSAVFNLHDINYRFFQNMTPFLLRILSFYQGMYADKFALAFFRRMSHYLGNVS